MIWVYKGEPDPRSVKARHRHFFLLASHSGASALRPIRDDLATVRAEKAARYEKLYLQRLKRARTEEEQMRWLGKTLRMQEIASEYGL